MWNAKLILCVMVSLAMVGIAFVQPCRLVAAAVPEASRAAAKTTSSPADSGGPAMSGMATCYSNKLEGRKTASGQRFSQKRLTAAHRTLPFGSKVRVTNVRSGQSVDVVINDRGPWPADRIIDLSATAAARIGMRKAGLAFVKLEILSGTATNNL